MILGASKVRTNFARMLSLFEVAARKGKRVLQNKKGAPSALASSGIAKLYLRSAASMVLTSNIVIVIGPTPPGTGVM